MKKTVKLSGKNDDLQEFLEVLKHVALEWGIIVVVKDK